MGMECLKIRRFLVFFVWFFLIGIFSCKKEDNSISINKNLVGKWSSLYNDNQTNMETLELKADGSFTLSSTLIAGDVNWLYPRTFLKFSVSATGSYSSTESDIALQSSSNVVIENVSNDERRFINDTFCIIKSPLFNTYFFYDKSYVRGIVNSDRILKVNFDKFSKSKRINARVKSIKDDQTLHQQVLELEFDDGVFGAKYIGLYGKE